MTKTSDLPTYRSLRTRLLAVVATTGMLLTALIGGVSATSASAASAPLPALPLSTSGNRIVDANGAAVTLQGVNWLCLVGLWLLITFILMGETLQLPNTGHFVRLQTQFPCGVF